MNMILIYKGRLHEVHSTMKMIEQVLLPQIIRILKSFLKFQKIHPTDLPTS